jgi:hypothetical protein
MSSAKQCYFFRRFIFEKNLFKKVLINAAGDQLNAKKNFFVSKLNTFFAENRMPGLPDFLGT